MEKAVKLENQSATTSNKGVKASGGCCLAPRGPEHLCLCVCVSSSENETSTHSCLVTLVSQNGGNVAVIFFRFIQTVYFWYNLSYFQAVQTPKQSKHLWHRVQLLLESWPLKNQTTVRLFLLNCWMPSAVMFVESLHNTMFQLDSQLIHHECAMRKNTNKRKNRNVKKTRCI